MTDSRRLVELRIHGMSGTPAENMLDTPAVVPVAGNELSGFWRPLVQPHQERNPPHGGERVLEGYRWGGLTSRAPLRALWTVLAPFALVNAASAMHLRGRKPAGEYRGIALGLEGALVRLFALSLTLMLVLAAFVTSVDIVGWQGARSSSGLVGFLDWSWLDTPAKRVAVLALVPVVVLIGLWLLGRTTYQRYELYAHSTPVHGLDGQEVRTPLECADFWNRAAPTRRLQQAHIAAALSFIALLVGVVLAKTGDTGHWILIAPAAALGASMLLCAIPNPPSAVSVVMISAMLVLGALLAYTYFGAELPADEGTTLPGSAGAVQVLFVAQVGMLIALALVGISRWLARHESEDIRLVGTGTACLSLGAFVIGAAFSAGVILRVADLIGKARPTAELGNVKKPIITPDAMAWAARGVTVALVAILALALLVFLFVRRARRRYEKPSVHPSSRRSQLASAIAWAKVTDKLDPIVLGVVLITVVTAVAAVVASFTGYSGDQPGWLPGSVASWRVVETVGTGIVVVFTLGLVLIMVRSYREEGLRRKVGILWDIATFWPRNAHPLGPPCYAERAVPELSARVAYFLLGDGEIPEPGFASSDIVLSAHSQGSVIATAALLQMAATKEIALLSYGSPLRRLYRAYFPVYFGDPALDVLASRVGGRWRNLYRDTDPIGGPVFHDPSDADQPGDAVDQPGDAVDQPVTTPPARHSGDTAPPAIEGHSNYPREPAYAHALDHLDEMLSAGTVRS